MSNEQMTYYPTDYAYPCETHINTLLNSEVVRKTLQKIASRYYADEIKELYNTSTLVNSENYPQLNAFYKTCNNKLQFNDNIPLYVTNRLIGINALSIELNDKQMVLISRQAVAQLNEDKLLFILGHELGHCQYGHMVCHTVCGLIRDMNEVNNLFGQLITDMIEVPLVQWFHCSEYTADRAGLICCGSLQTAYDIFCDLGMNDTNIDAFKQYQEISSPHPLLQTRWEKLQTFAKEIGIF